ncbi:MAG: hypothetical protein ACRBDL_01070 [Alphaproteobacteria bacterium]
MHVTSDAQTYKGTNIRTAVDKMRAQAIIRAKHDKTGLSLVHFNLTHFMHKSRHEDAFFILSQWAVEPVRRQQKKFFQSPKEGHKALHGRINTLIESLRARKDTNDEFVENARIHMIGTIERVMAHIINSTDDFQGQNNLNEDKIVS